MSGQSAESFKRIRREDLKFANDFTRLKIKANQCRKEIKEDNANMEKKGCNRKEEKPFKHLKLENGFTFHLN